MRHDGRGRHWPTRLNVGGHLAQFGEREPVDLLHVHVENPAAGKSDGQRVVVAHPEALEHGTPEPMTCCASS